MSGDALSSIHQLALNESPYPPLPSVQAAIQRTAVNRYPEFYPDRLANLIADHHGVSAECVVVGNGSVGVALQFLHAVVRPGDRLIYAWRNFDGYPLLAQMVRAAPTAVPLDFDGRQDLDAMARAVDGRTAAVLLCNPHNPTGSLITADMLAAFLRRIPQDVVVVLDEAYVDFARDADLPDSVALLRHHPNVLVLRTFSKAYGLAALRVGYGLAAPALIARVREQQMPYGINAVAAAAVEASLQAISELDRRVGRVVAERYRLHRELSLRGWRVLPSHANFLWLAEPDRVSECRAALETVGVLARHHPSEGIRLTVGDRAANEAVLTALTVVDQYL